MRTCRLISFPTKVDDSSTLAMNESDRAWVREEIKKYASGFVGGLKTWGPLLGTAGLVLFALVQWGDYKEFRGSTASQLTEITKHLDKIDTQLRSLQVQSQLAPISSSLQLAQKGISKPDPKELASIAEKLIPIQDSYSDVASVWKTTGEFINYKYQAANPQFQQTKGALLMNCQNGHATISTEGAKFENCEINLSHAVGGNVRQIIFINCIIDYDGGNIPTAPIVFDRCIFRFNVPVVPPPRAMRTMQLLAQSEESIVKIPS